ncbi:MAG: PDZ domain-containing protein [Chloroflexi bacterium]|nr:PDZ domain-containing protein [Chloroflexota bacterium]MDL1883400.1 PDZ domain-containing protein [Anaerolineae bacterium CFX8]
MHKRSVIYVFVALLALAALSAVGLAAAQDENAAPPYLGILVDEAPDGGVLVREVAPGGPGEEAGLKSGDILKAINDEAVSQDNIRNVLAAFAVGDVVTLSVERGGETLTLEATLAARPEQPSLPRSGDFRMSEQAMLLGLWLETTDDGVVVRQVMAGSPAETAGLKDGDIITKIGDTEVKQLRDILEAARSLKAGDTLAVEVNRDGETITLEVEPAQFGFSGRLPRLEMPFNFDMMAGSARLGVTFVMLDEQTAQERGLDLTEGALITEVAEDSPAQAAGLLVDDIITAVNGDVVDAEHTLRDRLLAYEPGDTVTLSVQRGGELLELDATLDEMGVNFGSMMMPGGFHFFGPDGFDFNFGDGQPGFFFGPRGFMFPNIPQAPSVEPAQPNL